MEHFSELRRKMVNEQIITRGITDKKVIDALLKIPRHEFIGPNLWDQVYNDYPLPTGCGQTISQPYMVALMTQLLELTGQEKVLEIGTGSGYQTAVLAELSHDVYSVERFEKLANAAKQVLDTLNYKNISIKVGDGTTGWVEFSPYDCIIVTASSPEIPQPLIEQLTDNGRMVIPVGGAFSQELTLVRKKGDKIITNSICGCVFVPLVGDYGWKE